MKARIGILETDKLIEVEIDNVKSFKKEIERAVRDGDLAWLIDTKGRSDRKSTRLNSSHSQQSRMPSSA